ncbi:MAG: AmmeMemoRadiSam system protein A [Candidatus Omnitrophica bacterium]|nr:AmmeMemoRadiSam system protein A [Candidatus Omnitrophota bacterium]
MLNKVQRKKLLVIARNTIETYLISGKELTLTETDPALTRNAGVFVSLHENNSLRGCIGSLCASGPLFLAVRDMAIQAALCDPRFPSLTISELPQVEIEISVLSKMKRINSIEEIELGKHGVMVKKGSCCGVYLPQVALETGWSKEEFLSSLCAHKAGLPSEAWKDKFTEVCIFGAEVFSEKDN